MSPVVVQLPMGMDFWRHEAARLFGVAYVDVTNDQRRVARSARYAYAYGAGGNTFYNSLSEDDQKLYQSRSV